MVYLLHDIDRKLGLSYIWAQLYGLSFHGARMTEAASEQLAEQVLETLGRREPRAAFVTEVAASIRPTPAKEAMEEALRELGSEGRVLVSDYASPDPHLDTTDLRVVASVPESDESAALEAAEAHWNNWLRAFLRTHRCQ